MLSSASSDSSGGGAPLYSPGPSANPTPRPNTRQKSLASPAKIKPATKLKSGASLRPPGADSPEGGAPLYPKNDFYSARAPTKTSRPPSTLPQPTAVSVDGSSDESSESSDSSESEEEEEAPARKSGKTIAHKKSSIHNVAQHSNRGSQHLSSYSNTVMGQSSMNAMSLVPYTGGQTEAPIEAVKQACQAATLMQLNLQQTVLDQPGISRQTKALLIDEIRGIGEKIAEAQRAAAQVVADTGTEHDTTVASEDEDDKAELKMLQERLMRLEVKKDKQKQKQKQKKKERKKKQSATKTGSGLSLANDAQRKLVADKCEEWIHKGNDGPQGSSANNVFSSSMSNMPADIPIIGSSSQLLGTFRTGAGTKTEDRGAFNLPKPRSPISTLSKQNSRGQVYGGPPPHPTPCRSPRRNATYGGNTGLQSKQGHSSNDGFAREAAMLGFGSNGTGAGPSNFNNQLVPASSYGPQSTSLYGNGPPNRPHRNNGNNRYASTGSQGAYGYSGASGRRDTGMSASSYSTLEPNSSASNIIPAWVTKGGDDFKALGPAPGMPLSSQDERWNKEIFKVFDMIKTWVMANCSEVDNHSTTRLPTNNPTLWDYMCKVSYPKDLNQAANHSRALLNDAKMRPYFTMRLITQFIAQKIWTPECWEGIDEGLTLQLRAVRGRNERAAHYGQVLSPAERYAQVDKIANCVGNFLKGPDAPRRKSQMTTGMSLRLKSIIGPLMNRNVDKEAAMWDLNIMAEAALRVSALINTSRLEWNFIFNECGVKFSDQSHYPLNSATQPALLQNRHYRVHCVVTPGITYRDDASGSIHPKFIAKANVLVMK